MLVHGRIIGDVAASLAGYAELSPDAVVSLEEQEGTKLGNASNGYSNDAFDTKYVAKRQRATVLFGGFKWNIPAEEVTLSTTRKVFVEQTSDLDGYSMVKFVNDEIARYSGTNDKTLTESCKLYLKLKEPEIIDYILVDGSDYKTRTENSIKVGLTIKPKYDDGTFGKEIPFAMERAESWVWLKDSVIYENVDFFMQETASKLELVGDVTKTVRTQKDNGGVFSFNEYEFTFRETRTYEIISDVAQMRSEIGLLYENGFNRKIIGKLLKENHLSFTPLFCATPHVFVSRDHPLAGRKEVTLEDLEPYPCLSFEQGQYNSFYFSEEILSELPHARSIHVSDRATLFNFLVGLSGYTISSGFLSEELNGGDIIVSVRLRVDDEMHIGYIRRKSGELSRFAGLYIEELRKVIKEAGYEPEEEAPAPPAMD